MLTLSPQFCKFSFARLHETLAWKRFQHKLSLSVTNKVIWPGLSGVLFFGSNDVTYASADDFTFFPIYFW